MAIKASDLEFNKNEDSIKMLISDMEMKLEKTIRKSAVIVVLSLIETEKRTVMQIDIVCVEKGVLIYYERSQKLEVCIPKRTIND